MDPFIQFLLGQGGNPAQAQQAPAASPDVIEVRDAPFPKRKPSFFDKQGTGGKILGGLGDALLIGTGHDPIYGPRVKQQRLGDAMAGFTEDPARSIEQVAQIDAEMGQKMGEEFADRQSLQAVRDAQVREAQDKYEGTTHERALAYLGAATPATYPEIKRIVDKWYNDRGVEPMFQLPDVYDEGAIRSLATGGIPVADQRKLDEDKRYHDAQIAEGRREEFGRNYRENLGEIMSTERNNTSEAASTERTTQTNQTRRETARRGPNRPNIRIVVGPDGKRRVVRK